MYRRGDTICCGSCSLPTALVVKTVEDLFDGALLDLDPDYDNFENIRCRDCGSINDNWRSSYYVMTTTLSEALYGEDSD